MIYYCDRCRAALPGGAKTCPQCGRAFNDPVPVDDILQNRTAGGASGNVSPAWYGSAAGKTRPVWLFVTAGIIGLAAILALAGWGANALWMRSAGGDLAFRQHNYAGNAAAERGDFQTADNEYGQMIALRPRRDDGYLLRAISEMEEGLTTASIDDDTSALGLAREPTVRGDLFYNRAAAQAKRGALLPAVADYTQAKREYARERDPRMTAQIPDRIEGVYSMRADAYWRHKDYALSIQDSKAAIALGHVHPDDYGVQAKAEAALGRDQAAQADFTQALQMDPNYLDGYIGLGALAEKHHQYAQAVSVFARATQVSPGSAQFWGSLGWFQYESGQTAQAIESDRRSQALDAGQEWVRYNLALTYAAAGRSALSQAAYADALARSTPQDRQAGLADIRHALAKQPGSAALRLALAQVQGGSTGVPLAARPPLPVLPPVPALPASPAPRPPAAYAALLAPEVVMQGYGIQPPAGYTLTQSRHVMLSGSDTVYLWSGPRRADGTTPTLQVVIGQDDGSLAAHSSSRQVTQATLTGMGDNHTGLTVSPVTALTLGSLSFAGGEWDGTGVQTGKEYKGGEYWSVSPSHLIHLSSHDAVPYSHVTMPLLKAAILTFRKM